MYLNSPYISRREPIVWCYAILRRIWSHIYICRTTFPGLPIGNFEYKFLMIWRVFCKFEFQGKNGINVDVFCVCVCVCKMKL